MTSYNHQNIVHVSAGRRMVKLTMVVVDLRFPLPPKVVLESTAQAFLML
jgi:hypothetical protein